MKNFSKWNLVQMGVSKTSENGTFMQADGITRGKSEVWGGVFGDHQVKWFH